MSEIVRALELLHPETRLIELRPIMPGGRWWQGLYDDRNKLARTIENLNEIEAPAIYWTVNPISPALADRVTNRLAPAKRGGCIGNKDIDRIKWLFLDLDNKGSREATLALAENIRNHLAGKGWPDPHQISSGTGCYLFYAVDLHPKQAPLIKKVVKNLAAQFDTKEAIVDKKCANPGRIARVPGSYNRKDDAILCRFMGVANG
jgi:hypothetical protein